MDWRLCVRREHNLVRARPFLIIISQSAKVSSVLNLHWRMLHFSSLFINAMYMQTEMSKKVLFMRSKEIKRQHCRKSRILKFSHVKVAGELNARHRTNGDEEENFLNVEGGDPQNRALVQHRAFGVRVFLPLRIYFLKIIIIIYLFLIIFMYVEVFLPWWEPVLRRS